MMTAILILSAFTLICMYIGVWAADSGYKDTAASGAIGAFCFGVPLVYLLIKGALA